MWVEYQVIQVFFFDGFLVEALGQVVLGHVFRNRQVQLPICFDLRQQPAIIDELPQRSVEVVDEGAAGKALDLHGNFCVFTFRADQGLGP